ncbi:hypothetical protein V8F20_010301 [Naviculisporaceae sp. PSN 640]
MSQSTAFLSARTWLPLCALVTIATICQAQVVTNGPEALVSLGNEMDYKLGRSCAVGCLVYNKNTPCAAGAFYQDLGVWLGCDRCHQINGCYCKTAFASSATSLIDECVSRQCSGAGVADWDQEVTNMLSLYDGYCATANVAVPTTTRIRPAATKTPGATTADSPPPDPGAGAGSVTGGAPIETNPPSPSDTSASAPDGDKKSGLSQSDIVALAASLGVGIPSLLIAAITLCVQLKKRKRRQQADEGRSLVGSMPASVSHSPFPSHSSTPVPQGQGWNVPGATRGPENVQANCQIKLRAAFRPNTTKSAHPVGAG